MYYSKKLREVGVFVYEDSWRPIEAVLARRRYDLIFVEFWQHAEQFLDTIVRWQPWARVIIDTVDVHFLREESGLALGISDGIAVQSRKIRELAVYRRADVVLVVTAEDQQALQRHGVKSVTVIPNIVDPRMRPAEPRGHDILFVGGFAHIPNVDGIRWFATTIWPDVHAAVPDARLLVIGSDPPPAVEELGKICGVKVLGYVADTGIYLDQAAVSVAPLRYGGGMKGKVTEALAAGVPVIATSIGAQGFGAESGQHLMVVDSATAFAGAVVKLLRDPIAAESMGHAGYKMVMSLCSPQAVSAKVRELLAKNGANKTIRGWPILRWLWRAYVFRAQTLVRASTKRVHWRRIVQKGAVETPGT
ncbi:MAG TPA: glycosyltransferase [Tepidisphaeraceae bacterium]|nr:glycosyltransferase [Tepidisphaeraceae bacterium]